MTIPQPPIEAELFARRLDGIIGQAELQVIREIQPAIDALMQALDEEAEGGISDERLDQLTAPFNQQLQNLLAGAMFTLQEPLRDHAATAGPLRSPAPFFGTEALMKRAVMEGENISTWFRRRSPSKWQSGLIDLVRGGLQQGFRETVNTVREGVTRLVNTVVETALWSMAGQQLTLNWREPERWLYVAVLDSSTCPTCFPWANRTAKKLSQMPDVPQHPRCRCNLYPLFTDEVAA